MIVALIAGIVGGALWGGIVGLLKARTGAHEVIVDDHAQLRRVLPACSWMLRTPGPAAGAGLEQPEDRRR